FVERWCKTSGGIRLHISTAILNRKHKIAAISFVALVAVTGAAGCNVRPSTARTPVQNLDCEIALAPQDGALQIDGEISRLQGQVRNARDPIPALEQLGWSFVEKARQTYDPGYYKIAETCASCMEKTQPGNAEALLIRGHSLNSLHKFKEA